jgi:hypothetical protein
MVATTTVTGTTDKNNRSCHDVTIAASAHHPVPRPVGGNVGKSMYNIVTSDSTPIGACAVWSPRPRSTGLASPVEAVNRS